MAGPYLPLFLWLHNTAEEVHPIQRNLLTIQHFLLLLRFQPKPWWFNWRRVHAHRCKSRGVNGWTVWTRENFSALWIINQAAAAASHIHDYTASLPLPVRVHHRSCTPLVNCAMCVCVSEICFLTSCRVRMSFFTARSSASTWSTNWGSQEWMFRASPLKRRDDKLLPLSLYLQPLLYWSFRLPFFFSIAAMHAIHGRMAGLVSVCCVEGAGVPHFSSRKDSHIPGLQHFRCQEAGWGSGHRASPHGPGTRILWEPL